jgi:hypothetical protein
VYVRTIQIAATALIYGFTVVTRNVALRADWRRRPESLHVNRTGPSYVDGTRAPRAKSKQRSFGPLAGLRLSGARRTPAAACDCCGDSVQMDAP